MADEVIGALGTRLFLDRHPSLDMLTSWLEQGDRLVEAITAESNWQHVVTLEDVVTRAYGNYDGLEEPTSILDHVRQTLEQSLVGGLEFWGDEYPVRVVAPLVSTSLETRILEFVFTRFDESVEWDGLFQDLSFYRTWLQGRGYLVSMEQLAGVPSQTILRMWGVG